ncbi:MAG: hypothetical protein EKK42_15650 [Pseudonocardiaceae bacterium]|nr:MAG: hypothetical protein EKK42_15650 [Pseudonocardiaceae bacterium]
MTFPSDPVSAKIDGVNNECVTLHVTPRLLYIVQSGPTILAEFSVLLELTDPELDPLFDVLGGRCFLIPVDRVEPDPGMYHRQARVMFFALLGEHDETVPHFCGARFTDPEVIG